MKKNHMPGLTLIEWYLVFLIALFLAAVIGCDTQRERNLPARDPARVVVAFTASWCGPCRRAKPEIHAISAAGVRVELVDIDAEPARAKLAGIRSVPTFLVLAGGVEVARTHDVSDLRRILGGPEQ